MSDIAERLPDKSQEKLLFDLIYGLNKLGDEMKEMRTEAKAWRDSFEMGKTAGTVGFTSGMVVAILGVAVINWLKTRLNK